MKKIIALVLAMVMMMGVAAYADNGLNHIRYEEVSDKQVDIFMGICEEHLDTCYITDMRNDETHRVYVDALKQDLESLDKHFEKKGCEGYCMYILMGETRCTVVNVAIPADLYIDDLREYAEKYDALVFTYSVEF